MSWRTAGPEARRRSILIILALVLIACAPVRAQQSRPLAATPTFEPVPTGTPSSTPVPTALPPLTPAATLITCDPISAGFCITEGNFLFQRPVQPPANDSVDGSYPYGSTAGGTRDPHHGVEFVNASGTPVYAAADGTVLFAGPDREALYAPWADFYGNLIVLEHANSVFTLYAHLSEIYVREGQQVRAGDRIGEIGSTGTAIGSHLHFEVRQGDARDYSATRNPELWLLPKRDANGVLRGALAISIVDRALDPCDAVLTIDYHADPDLPRVRSYYITTYARELLNGAENAALGELPPGHYRIAVSCNGRLYERWVEVQSGKLTEVVLIVE